MRGFIPSDIAEALVATGVPFREAHRRVGELVGALEAERRSFRDLSAVEWAALRVANGPDLLDADRSVRARASRGGPSPASVRKQVAALEGALSFQT
jgi:argininosuccinate lyase